MIEMSKDDLDGLGLFGSVLGHVGDGNFHETILYEDKDRKKVEDCVHKMIHRALEMEGTCTVRENSQPQMPESSTDRADIRSRASTVLAWERRSSCARKLGMSLSK
jgi:FAD/FMN-containing dehydrogenase